MLEEAVAAYEFAPSAHDPWMRGVAAFWLWRAKAWQGNVETLAEPYAGHIGGDPADAAIAWERLQSPFESALALADTGHPDRIKRAFSILHEIDAPAAAEALGRELRERGLRHLPRGPRPATRSAPAGLTRREAEVLELLERGLRNAGIAALLSLSERTVAHHVSAVLSKLGVSTRGAAASRARALRKS